LANQELTIGMITRETLAVLENQLTFTRLVNREFDDSFAKKGAKIGNVLNVRLPVRAFPANGQALILQDLTETSIPVALNKQYQRSFAVTSADLALNIDDFSKRFVRPFMMSMANEIDFDGLALVSQINNEVGTPGTVPTTIATFLAAAQRLNEEAAPMEDRYVIMSPGMNAAIVPALAGLFNPQVKIGAQNIKGIMGKNTFGADWYMDQNTRNQVVGPLGGTPVVNGAAQTGSSLITNAWTAAAASRLNVGDVFTIGAGATGVFATNPQSGQSTGALRQFVVTAPGSSDGAGNLTINISPAIVVSGAFKNVTGLTADITGPANGATINVNGAANTSSPRGLMFCRDAFTFVTADLPLYGGLDMGERAPLDQDLNISVRVIRDFDINMDRAPLRIDALGGWAVLYQQLAVRIAS
jgi:hypothetical protein